MTKVDSIILLSVLVLQCALGALLVWRKAHREFPFFFAYILSSIMANGVQLCTIRGDYLIFFKVYWASEVVSTVTALLALHEAFRWVFLDFYEFWWFRFLFPGVAALIITLAATHTLRHPPAQVPEIVGVILSLGIAVIYVKAGLFALFLLFVIVFTLQWYSYPFGIVFGFAVSALGSAFAYGLFYDFGTRFSFVSKYAVSVAYICAVILWLETFRRLPHPNVPDGSPAANMEELLEEGQRYVKILKGLGKKNGP